MTAWDNFELVTLNCKATWLSLWVECFDMTGGKGLHALHLADGYGGMRASASVIVIVIEIEKTEANNHKHKLQGRLRLCLGIQVWKQSS